MSAHSIALGAAVGVFIAFTPTMGVQIVLTALVATWFKASRISAIIMVYITNPLTMGPIYTFTYWIGVRVLGSPMHGTQDLYHALKAEGWIATIVGFFKAGADLALPLWVGGSLVGLVLAVPTYAILLRLVLGHRMLRESKRIRRELRVEEAIEEAKDKEQGEGLLHIPLQATKRPAEENRPKPDHRPHRQRVTSEAAERLKS